MKGGAISTLARRHRRLGWCTLFVFLLLGAALDLLHGFKIGFYLDVSNEARRHLWTLAHAHGALISLIHLAFASAVQRQPEGNSGTTSRILEVASVALRMATILLPGGFFLGGAMIYGGDPGLGILLVPFGAIALATAVACTAWVESRSQGSS